MNNLESNQLGMNKTGIKMSPIDSKKMVADVTLLTVAPPGDEYSIAENRVLYMKEAEPVGTVPLPATIRGMVSAVHEKMVQGGHLLMDKLGERIAFERTGTRLYDALISKHQGSEDLNLPPIELLQQIRNEEKDHFHLLCAAMETLGGDYTAMTPAADIAGVASMGLIQVVTDPRTTFLQALDAILIAELTDNDSWELLIQLTEKAGLTELRDKFQVALQEEASHLAHVRSWIKDLSLNQGVAGVEKH